MMQTLVGLGLGLAQEPGCWRSVTSAFWRVVALRHLGLFLGFVEGWWKLAGYLKRA